MSAPTDNGRGPAWGALQFPYHWRGAEGSRRGANLERP
jgi:hypothetical protein